MRHTDTWRSAGLAILLALLAACAGTVPVEKGPQISEAALDAFEARMAQHVTDGDVKGIATRLIIDGKIVSDERAGIRRAADNAPIEDDTIYRIYSMSKPITGVAMMMLYEEGKFSLDDPVTKYVPEFEALRVMTGVDADGKAIVTAPNRAPTMREVMNHTAGFAYGLFGDDPANTAFRDQKIMASPDLETFIDKVADVPLLFQPGTAWSYSAAVDVQGYIVQKLSGQSFGAFLDERIFTPLGMVDTGFYVPAEDYDRLSDVFGYDPETKTLVAVPYPQVMFREETVGMESGGGGLVSTMNDYTRFAQMMLNGGELDGVRLLKPETVDLMRTDTLPEGAKLFSDGSQPNRNTEGLGFGLDFGLVNDPEAAGLPQGEGTYFWGGAAGTWFWIDPENDLIFIGMIQRFARGGPEVDFRNGCADLVYQVLEN